MLKLHGESTPTGSIISGISTFRMWFRRSGPITAHLQKHNQAVVRFDKERSEHRTAFRLAF